MKFARLLIGAGMLLGISAAAHAVPVVVPATATSATQVQLNCVGPTCYTTGPIRQPYLRGTQPPGTEWFRQSPPRPPIKLQQPQMDYRVPRIKPNQPKMLHIRPSDPSTRIIGTSQQHKEWCAERYRSYRAADNSYKPLSGPRKQCQSPYG
ncbi:MULTISPECIES: BA14K family protein [Mesorhizobium]|uniref:Lectin-like protein BA14k n=1 Tax=Mesorhizobium denitrificans TaxID=2294114 RepID=A0A371XG14_9HYPH|nr:MULTISPECIES: BA14K family protein [Mesorhizobium]RFC68172.1 BA14K family protein [Mesorhizobium denitrificans]